MKPLCSYSFPPYCNKTAKNVHQWYKAYETNHYSTPDSRSEKNIKALHRGLEDATQSKHISKSETIEMIPESIVLTFVH